MKKTYLKNILGLILLVIFSIQCSVDTPQAPEYQLQSYPITYVALGNSLTAGYQSGGMRKDWQENSYPALLAKDLNISDFQQPIIDTPGIGPMINGQLRTPYYFDGVSIKTDPLTVNPEDLLSNKLLSRPYNNLGIPGATTKDLLYATNSATSQSGNNPYFDMILRNPNFGNSTPLQQAILLNPTLITLWIGNNDILGGVVSGTIVEGVTVTPVDSYRSMMDAIFDSLLNQTHANIYVANIPDIASIPFVTTIPPVIFNPETFQPVAGNISFLTEEDNVKYILFSALDSILIGVGIPQQLGGTGRKLPGFFTLTEEEVDQVNSLVESYNSYLEEKASSNNRIFLVDIHQLMKDLEEGKIEGLSAKFFLLDPQNTAFSLDGVHPNNRGYKYIEKEFLKVILNSMSGS